MLQLCVQEIVVFVSLTTESLGSFGPLLSFGVLAFVSSVSSTEILTTTSDGDAGDGSPIPTAPQHELSTSKLTQQYVTKISTDAILHRPYAVL